MAAMKHPNQPFEPGVEYVLGFAFHKNRVLLIRKNRPQWQAGFVNGVGGKVEAYDWSLTEAMRREFEEETGVNTDLDSWSFFGSHLKPGTYNGDPASYSLHLFSLFLDDQQAASVTMKTDEEPVWFDQSDFQRIIQEGTPGCAMYVLMAMNHANRSFFTTTTESV